ncbi:succinoglycan biosynthesis transport protein ExoP [Rhizobium sp. BK077]|uniref:AAA family ATPase n=1 Tax=Rhizobium TaxID=379 RepID=UPI000BE8343B|nr:MULTISPECIES: AAA family ATPase [Rhizobium]MBB3302890.1 succinoglycan biosynthesis transport protein ExoP [Rhizobium sp. BK112]MBB3372245.1 succinoglycan biosynthesis transport protein ExoP [Rhizobium sp. BK077]MBB4182750.1 succinoglycan biosynthesis transport protein ExoP [Rhizobium sp. BK109]PDS54585.1 chromosome partitioning protein ParA [Rhizobium anhuiense]
MLSPFRNDAAELGSEFRTRRDNFDVDAILAIIRRRWTLVAVALAAGLVVGAAFLLSAVPMYTASATLLIDKSNSGLLSQMSETGAAVNDDAAVLSEVEVLRSDSVALSVVDKFKLQDNATFMSPSQSLRSSLAQLLDLRRFFSSSTEDQDAADEARENAAAAVKANMSVSRVGRTYVLNIEYTSRSPALSAKIVNAIAEGYLLDKLNSKYDATRRASDWLEQRIDELRQKALETDLAVQKFKSDNGLLATSGQLISDQQLSELNRALIDAQAETAKAKARYDRIKIIIDAHRTDAIVTDVLDSSISNDLRMKYLEASKTEAEISARLGPNHTQAVRLRGQMAEYERMMFEELGRISESYKSDYDVALSKEKSLSDSVGQASKVSAAAGETQVQLRELERKADTFRNLYQTFLARYQEATQQQSFPITEARIIEKAQNPTVPSYPQKPLTLALFGILGIAAGMSASAFLEFQDKYFRTGDQVRNSLEIDFLGFMPAIKDGAANHVMTHPMSMFAETLRAAKIAIESDETSGCRVVGVVSALPGEGKSTAAINLAHLLAAEGSRTLLLDADFRQPGTSKLLAPNAESGLPQILNGSASAANLLIRIEESGVEFIPALVNKRVSNSAQLLSSKAMADFLAAARTKFDYVIIDLPPAGPVIDARAMAPLIDSFMLVIEWGMTSRKVVQAVLGSEPAIHSRMIGAVLNKVDTKKLKLYRSHGSVEYYHSKYSDYYLEEK